MMTIQEMYQELNDQMQEDLISGYSDFDMYDDIAIVSSDVDYTTQE